MTRRHLIQAMVSLTLIVQWICPCSAERYGEFMRLAEDGKGAEALELGDRLFKGLVAEKPDNAALATLAKRLEVARQVRALVAKAVGPNQSKLLESIAGMDDLGLVPPAPKDQDLPDMLPPSAQQWYWSHLRLFAGEWVPNGLPAQQATFLGRYYDLKVQDSIMNVARQVIVADPNSVESVCYAVVLPLLYLHGRDGTWDQVESVLAVFSPRQLDLLSKFSLLRAERPQASAQIARFEAKTAGQAFAIQGWAIAAADMCVAHHRPGLAEHSLCVAIDEVTNHNAIAELRFKIADGYARCGDYSMAAQLCDRILADLPGTSLYGRIMVTLLGYLARDGGAEQVIARAESALQEPRCRPYLAQILYLRWWGLRKVNRLTEATEIAQQLMEQHGSNPCVAPVLLERATDALAHQEYDRCRELLTRLTEDFPGADSARLARDILSRLAGRGTP